MLYHWNATYVTGTQFGDVAIVHVQIENAINLASVQVHMYNDYLTKKKVISVKTVDQVDVKQSLSMA